MTLAAIFDEAFLREKEIYEVRRSLVPGFSEVVMYGQEIRAGTQEECQRFIHQRARAAGFAALREAARLDDSLSEEQYLGVYDFLASLAGDDASEAG